MKLFYREFGSGIPLIILHGLYGSSDNWVSIAKSLSKDFRVIIPDQRNHGLSPHSIVHSYKSMSSDLDELVRDLKITKFLLIGHSMGGKTAIWYASRWPEMLTGLMIIDISPFKTGKHQNPVSEFHLNVLKAINNLPLNSINTREEADLLLSESVSSPRIRSFLLKNLTRTKDKSFGWKLNAENLEMNIDNILDGFDRNIADHSIISGFPVVFVRASKSDYIPESDYSDIRKIFPVSDIVSVEDASHWIHVEKPDQIIEIIYSMLE